MADADYDKMLGYNSRINELAEPLIKELLLSGSESIVHDLVVVLFHHMDVKLPLH